MIWPEGEDFVQLVGTAVKDRRSESAVRLRDRLAGPEIVDRTVDALGLIVDRIDAQLARPDVDEDAQRRREGARNSHYDWLVWYQTMAGLVGDSSDG